MIAFLGYQFYALQNYFSDLTKKKRLQRQGIVEGKIVRTPVIVRSQGWKIAILEVLNITSLLLSVFINV